MQLRMHVAATRYQVELLQRTSVLAQMIRRQTKIVGGRYDLDTGEVTMLI